MNYMNYMITIWIGYMETQSMQWHEIFQTKPIFLYSVFCLSAQVLKCSSSVRVPECLKCSSAKEPKCSSSTQVPLEFPWSELRVSLECPWSVLGVTLECSWSDLRVPLGCSFSAQFTFECSLSKKSLQHFKKC